MNETTQSAPRPEAPPLLEAREIVKTYGPTVAVNGFHMEINAGEVVGLLGGNGAGKSTLMRIISGVTQPDGGDLLFDGKPVNLRRLTPFGANQMGIRVVYQELSLCTNLTVYENFYVELRRLFRGNRSWRKSAGAHAQSMLDAIFPGHGIQPSQPMEQLSIAQQQMTEIARAFCDPQLRLLILDEPTSSLPKEQTEQLMAYIKKRAGDGVAFVFISHRLGEVIRLVDRIYIMQNGSNKWTGPVSSTSEEDLVRQMSGTGADAPPEGENKTGNRSVPEALNKDVWVEARSLTVGTLQNVSFRAQGGEIVGIAGLEGNGQVPLLHHLFRSRGKTGSGALGIQGTMAYVTGDRKKEGNFPLWSVRRNMMITSLAFGRLLHIVKGKREEALANRWYQHLKVKGAGLDAGITSLSGGNQQKVLIARALIADSDIILLDDPTRGVDIATKQQLYGIFREAAASGKLVLWHSSDDEELSICSRVLVMRFGTVVRELSGDGVTKENVVNASFSGAELEQKERHGSMENSPLSRLVRNNAFLPFLCMLVVYGACGLKSPAVFTGYGVELLLSGIAPLIFAAVAQMFVIGLGHSDLSIGAFMGLINVLAATVAVEAPLLGYPLLVVAVLLYSCMGLLIYYRGLPAIIITLGFSFIWRGIAISIQDRPGGMAPEWLWRIFWSDLPVPPAALVILGFSLLAHGFHRSKYGTVMRGFGNNQASMVRSGWSRPVAYWFTYLMAGTCGLLGGLVFTGITMASDANASASYTMLTIASVVMGGGMLSGGVVGVVGTVFGAVTFSLISSLLGFLRVSTELTAAVQGLILLFILSLRLLRKGRNAS